MLLNSDCTQPLILLNRFIINLRTLDCQYPPDSDNPQESSLQFRINTVLGNIGEPLHHVRHEASVDEQGEGNDYRASGNRPDISGRPDDSRVEEVSSIQCALDLVPDD